MKYFARHRYEIFCGAYTRPKHADATGAARLEHVGQEEVVAGAVAADDCVTIERLYDDRAIA